MPRKYKFRFTLKERSKKYFARVIKAFDTLPRGFSLQVLGKELILSTIEFTTASTWLNDAGVLINLKENQTILEAIELSKKEFPPVLQALLIETRELIVLAEASAQLSKS